MEREIAEHVQNDNNDGSDEYSNDEFTSDSTGDEACELHRAYSADPWKETGSSTHDKGSYSSRDENMRMPECLETCDEDVVAPVASDFLEKEFTSSEDAYKLYVLYARSVGFGVRKGDVRRNTAREITSRSFFCCKEGLRLQKHYVRVDRKRVPKAVTRTNCKARLVIYFDKGSGIWKVREFVEGHNHELTPRKFVHLIRNHRKITPAHKAQIDTMHKYGMQTCQILGYMAGQCGGYEAIGFSKKDLYNYIDKERRGKIIDGDASEAISYLEGRADVDGTTVARYTITEDERLGNLFWSDGLSRVDYQYFGDVLAFGRTRKTGDERIETYRWLLKQFLDVMANKEPSVVVTDGDESMREAIRRIFPRTTHRLCAWHLAKNVVSNIKEPAFCEAFKNCMYNNYTRTQFEEIWQVIVERFQLRDNRWVHGVYEKKEMWATTYLREKFCAGIQTTSRCEGINSFIKRFIKSRYSILELVQTLERVVKNYRNNELEAQFHSINTFPVYDTGLQSIEEAAAKVYTRAVFKEVKQEMEGVSSIIMIGKESISTLVKYQLCKFGQPNRLFEVLFDRVGDNNEPKFECDCHFWSMNGIPCSHMFFVMKNEHVAEIPTNLVIRRWRKDAKTFDDDGDVAD